MTEINFTNQKNLGQAAKLTKFILIDGHSLAFRSYYAFAKSSKGGLRSKTGIPTSVCFGFLKSLLEVIEAEKPEYLAIAFDLATPTFRHEADDNYKADRVETPEDFIIDLANLQEMLTALNLAIVTAPGYEADDVLGTLATQISDRGYIVKILTGDQDLFQLIDDHKNISVLRLGTDAFGRSGKGKSQEYKAAEVQEKLGIKPEQVIDYKALCGDTSDNIPGVKGIGEKTAVKLLTEYHSLDGIYAAIEQIKGAVKQKLETGKADAYHSQRLARIIIDVPLEITLEKCKLTGFDNNKLIPILEKLDFKNFLNQINNIQQRFGGKVAAEVIINQVTTDINQINNQQNSPQTQKNGEPEAHQKTKAINGKRANNITQLSLFEEKSSEILPNIIIKAPEALPIQPRIINTSEKLIELIELLEKCIDPNYPVAWDTETTGLNSRDAKLVGIGCCWGIGREDVAYIPTGHIEGIQLDLTTVLDNLKPIFEGNNYYKVLQNAKFDRLILLNHNIKLAGIIFDPMLASYVINPEFTHNLNDIVDRELGIILEGYKELVPKNQTIADIDIPAVANYCGMQVYATFQLVPKLRKKLENTPKLKELLENIEQPLEPVLAQMEYTGIRIDIDYLKNLSQQMQKDLEITEEKAYQAAGEKFNLGSPKQLSHILFDKLKLDTKKSRKIATGYSTDAAVLEKLQGDHPVIDAILEHRTLAKLKSTYIDALPDMVHKNTGRVHTNFNQTVTGTGRLSSSNPNLQNIPIRTEFSRQIRKAFLPEKDWLLVSADYSQIELRILAHLSQEPVLLAAYKNNQDVHSVTAKLLFEKENITAEERRLGKTINFGVIYGMGAQKFARSVGVTPAEGKKFIDRFYQTYGKVFEYLENVKKQAIAWGYVETILGRRRYFNFEAGSLRQMKGCQPSEINLDTLKKIGQNDAQLLRAAANAPIQGSSADIIKIAMVKLQEILLKYKSRLLLQVHDELVLEVYPDEWEELQSLIRDTMVNAVSLSLPLVVDIHAGKNWMEAK